MCILLCTRKHPDYPLIIASNRDEYFDRPTQLAGFIDENTLCPVDQGRQEHGTWIGITKRGRVAVLVNYREPAMECLNKISRGSIPMKFLKSNKKAITWSESANKHMNGFKDVGGFSLLFGELQASQGGKGIMPLHIMSNRYRETVSVFNTEETLNRQDNDRYHKMQLFDTIGLSNSPYLEPWPKVTEGKKLLEQFAENAVRQKWNKDKLVSKLFEVLTVAHPSDPEKWLNYNLEEGFDQMPKSIFVPPLRKTKGPACSESKSKPTSLYGTRTQTVILVDKHGKVTYVEKTLHSSEDLTEKPQLHCSEFQIQGWVDGRNAISAEKKQNDGCEMNEQTSKQTHPAKLLNSAN
ncbi:hypothetical protein BRETT_002279 [Brettanomyces bruxellensis]|uniref:DUF833-domain-containing protein n=1 Tax=Dekkera bruxellensis TaxID=5007 RepID=A0A871RI73_DEKBR|nr:uncharacterized protein BRETT_002279 [Brettanomyces bruxellensis]QOU22111.1 hypothetical protein BRETT_002279 [Brettanomyces bruxellensis]